MTREHYFKLNIVSSAGTLFQGEAESVSVNTTSGYITVLAHHVPLISTLAPGIITVKNEEGEKEFKVKSGVIDVGKDETAIVIHGKVDDTEQI